MRGATYFDANANAKDSNRGLAGPLCPIEVVNVGENVHEAMRTTPLLHRSTMRKLRQVTPSPEFSEQRDMAVIRVVANDSCWKTHHDPIC